MTPEQSRVHKKLLSRLPVRTHELTVEDDFYKQRVSPVEVDGKRFESISKCCKELDISTTTFYEWLDSGRAVRL